MKKITLIVAVVASALACQTTFAQEKDNASRRQPDNQVAPPVAGVQSNNPAAQTDEPINAHWVREAALGGMYEVQLSQLAVQKAISPEIKQFAQKVVDDHTRANEQLAQIAKMKKIDLPSQLEEGQKEKLAKFQKKEGQRFDKGYVNCITADHVHDILMFRDGSQDLRDPELKQFAAQQLPTLQQHYQRAAQLANFPGQDARPAGSSERGTGDTIRPGATGDAPRSDTPAPRSDTPKTDAPAPGANGSGTSGGAVGTPGTGSGTNGQNVGGGTTPAGINR